METKEKLQNLRALMAKFKIDAWLVPSADPHQSEYVAAHWQARAWISGFHGSAGTLVVTREKAGLWTDSRYYIRAAQELKSSSIELFKAGLPGVLNYYQWLKQELGEGTVVSFDGSLLSLSAVEKMEKALDGSGISLAVKGDLVDEIWPDRPALPMEPVFLLDEKYTGESRASKFARIREKMIEQGAQAHLVPMLDDIAWTLNIRGRDVTFNPVTISYLLVLEDDIRWFIEPQKVPQEVRKALQADGVSLYGYEDIDSHLAQLPEGSSILIDPAQTNCMLREAVPDACEVKRDKGIVTVMKAIKNRVEMEGIRRAHLRDGAAVARWMYWMDQVDLAEHHTEITLVDKLTAFRAEDEHFQGLSFSNISAYKANSAIGHYSPQPETTPLVHAEGLLLTDTGGQYLDGTTDITRVVSLGAPTAEEKRVFTTVLKSLIRLSTARFPQDTQGKMLDAIAREPLWQQGWQCRHSIGHGVGHFLNVHEGPHNFSPRCADGFSPGSVTTIEPGVYFEGKFGVRIENVVITTAVESTEFGDFCALETVTFCPIDLELVDVSMLNEEERAWLNNYHQETYTKLSPRLNEEERVWLRHETRVV
jgi:Xaa-Pro aminopeptidase